MISITSDEANKLVKDLNTQKSMLQKRMRDNCYFVAAVTEDKEECRPAFDFEKTVLEIEKIEDKICKINHARNKFNNITMMDNHKTVGENLVYLAILSSKLFEYENYATAQDRQRMPVSGNIIEYKYVNFDLNFAKNKYEELRNEISAIQQDLNIVNTTKKFDVDI